jgi:hypothetical protein
LLFTSREKPKGFATKEDEYLSIRSPYLKGLQSVEVRQLLDKKGVYAHFEDIWNQLIQQYEGNPLILKSVIKTIQNLFGGDIAEFLACKSVIFGDAWDLLEQQVVYWLVIKHSASLTELAMDIAPPIAQRKLLEALESLERRSLIKRSSRGIYSKTND